MDKIDVIVIGRTHGNKPIVKRLDTNEAFIVNVWEIYNNNSPVHYVYEYKLICSAGVNGNTTNS